MGRVASAILCNFSTYIDSNGDPVRVDYVTVAPLYINQDQIRTTLGDYVDLEDGFPFATKWQLDENIGDIDYLFEFSSVLDSSRLYCYYYLLTRLLVLRWKDSADATKCKLEIPVATVADLDISGTVSSGGATLTVNGATVSTSTIDGGASTVNLLAHGGNYAGSNDALGLLYSFECDATGKFDFKQNKNNGLTTISSTGVLATIDEDIAGSTQINEDGTSSTSYNWPESVKELIPQTGGVNLVNDVLQTQWSEIDYGQQFPEINVTMTLPYVPYESSVTLFELEHGSTTNNYIRFQRVSETQYRLEAREGSDNYGTSTITSILHDERIHLKIMFVDNTMKMYQNGIKIIDTWFNTTVLPINTWLMNRWAIGGQYYNFGNKQMVVDYFEIPQVDRWDVSKQRMVAESETPLTSFIGLDNGKEIAFTQKTPHNALFPYELSSSTAYLKEDHQLINDACVTIPAGSVPPSVGGDFTTEFTGEFL